MPGALMELAALNSNRDPYIDCRVEPKVDNMWVSSTRNDEFSRYGGRASFVHFMQKSTYDFRDQRLIGDSILKN